MRRLLAIAALAVGCQETVEPSPTPAAVVPGWAIVNRAATIEIQGQGIEADLRADLATGVLLVNDTFRAWLGDAELLDVKFKEKGVLTARVPAGLAAGTYALTIEDPLGRKGVLPASNPAAFQVVEIVGVELTADKTDLIATEDRLNVHARIRHKAVGAAQYVEPLNLGDVDIFDEEGSNLLDPSVTRDRFTASWKVHKEIEGGAQQFTFRAVERISGREHEALLHVTVRPGPVKTIELLGVEDTDFIVRVGAEVHLAAISRDEKENLVPALIAEDVHLEARYLRDGHTEALTQRTLEDGVVHVRFPAPLETQRIQVVARRGAAQGSVLLDVLAGPPDRLEICRFDDNTCPGTVSERAGESVSLYARVLDVNGNTYRLQDPGARFGFDRPVSALGFGNGHYQFAFAMPQQAGRSTLKVTAEIDDDALTDLIELSASVDMLSTPVEVNRLVLTHSPTAPVVGTRVTVTARALDRFENSVPFDHPSQIFAEVMTGGGSFEPDGATVTGAGDIRFTYRVIDAQTDVRIRASILPDLFPAGEVAFATVPDAPVRMRACLPAVSTVDAQVVVFDDANSDCAVQSDVVAGRRVFVSARLYDRYGNRVPIAAVRDVAFLVQRGAGAWERAPFFSEGAVVDAYQTHVLVEDATLAVVKESSTEVVGMVSIHGVPGSPREVILTATPPDPEVGTEVLLRAEMRDENGNRVRATEARQIEFQVFDGAGSLAADARTDADGAVVVRYLTGQAVERARVRAIETVSGRFAEVSLQSRPGAVTQFEVASAHPRPIAGDRVDFSLVARDRFGNVATDFNARALLSDTTGTVLAVLTGTRCTGDFAAGRRTESVVLTRATALTRVSAAVAGAGCTSSAGGPTGQSGPVEVLPADVRCFRLDVPGASESTDAAQCRESGGPAGVALGPQDAGSEFGLTITARDAFGNIARGFSGYVLLADLTGTAATGSGSTFTPLAAGRGTASLRVTRVHAADRIVVDDGAQHVGASLLFPVLPGPPAALAFTSAPLSLEPDAASELTLALRDAYGNATVALPGGVTVGLSSSSTGGAFAAAAGGPYAATLALPFAPGAGTGRAWYKDSVDGDPTLTAAAPGMTAATQPAVIRAPNREARVVFAGPNTPVDAGAPSLMQIELRTASGRPICPALADHLVQLSTTSAKGEFALSAAFDDAVTEILIRAADCAGLVYYRDKLAGQPTLRLASVGLTGDERNVEVNPLGADRFTLERIADTQAGQAFPVAITALDVYGNVATGFAAIATLTMSDGVSDLSPASASFSEGTAQVQASATVARTVALRAKSGAIVGVSNNFVVSPGPLVGFSAAPIGPQRAGIDFTLGVTALDGHGNVATSFTGRVQLNDLSVSLTTQGGPAPPFDSAPFVAGVLSQAVRVTRVRALDRVTISDGVPAHAAQSNAFDVRNGPLDRFVLSAVGAQQRSGRAIDPAVVIRAMDAYANDATDFVGTVTVSDELAAFVSFSSPAFVAGQATVAPVFTRPAACTTELQNDRLAVADAANHTGATNRYAVSPPSPAALVASASASPLVLYEGDAVTLTLTVQNTGELTAMAVVPEPASPTISPDTLAGIGPPTSVPSPAFSNIPAGGTHTFRWTYRPDMGETGRVSFTAGARATSNGCNVPASSQQATTPEPVHVAPSTCFTKPVWADAGSEVVFPACGTTSSVSLGGAPTAGGGVAPYRYVWRADDGKTDGLDDLRAANPVTGWPRTARNRVWTVRVTDARGCSAEDTAGVTFGSGLPAAGFTMSAPIGRAHTPDLICRGDMLNFNAPVVLGTSHTWDFGDGTASPTLFHPYNTIGTYRVRLRVSKSANGCSADAETTVYVSNSDKPGGPLTFLPSPTTAPADGVAEVTINGTGIWACDSNLVDSGETLTVMAARGTVTTADRSAFTSSPGIQIRTSSNGAVSFKVRTDRQGGLATFYGIAGADRTRFGGSGLASAIFAPPRSLPAPAEIFPSGRQPASPPRIAVRFSEAMDPATVNATTFRVKAVNGGAVAGVVSYDAVTGVASFTPAAPLNMESGSYEVRLAGATSLPAQGGGAMPLDGDLDGATENGTPGDDLWWILGDGAGDGSAPTLTCNTLSVKSFSPDGDLLAMGTAGGDEIALPWSNGLDDVAQRWIALRVTENVSGRAVRAFLRPWSGTSGSLRWDGRDDSGRIVPNGGYRAEMRGYDAAGNASEPCGFDVDVAAFIDAR